MSGSQPMDCSRRAVLAGGVALAASRAFAAPSAPMALIAGTYAQEGGKGLYTLTRSGSGWSVDPSVPPIRNISFGTRSSRLGLSYLVSEGDKGSLDVFDRGYASVAERATRGSGPCHVALSADGSALAAANYSSGDVAVWAIDPATGLPRGEAQLLKHTGSGPNADRQAGPHAHWVGFTKDLHWLHSVDLGADAIFAHAYDASAQKAGETKIAYRAPAGSGPRHLARHPRLPVCYLASELSNTLTVLAAATDGTFRSIDTMPTLPAGFTGHSQVAHIAINAAGTRLYISNRGHNSVAVFALAPDGGARLLQHAPSGGDWPRFFLLIEEQGEMLVANERSGTVARLSIGSDGRLRPEPGVVAVPGVVFLALK
ncbi:lactonase family protein [Sphingomonas sp. AP4-R1]|uniref:lactonase family protein n=1 Tax=Sphingomonas sp. AP4-R1 TaxID=2735134 RepID=UPI001493B2DE|nr:lactonase family protein [Sphingomonas sp. AP4-R1]QJU59050.1 lactonase family protein [Sphingomonas sp. AP4-R1]